MKKIKIAHCLCGLEGGVSNVILNYFDHMPLEDYEVHILSNDVTSELYMNHYVSRDFKVIKIPEMLKSPFKSFKAFRRLMKENDYDVVHAHMTLTSIFPLLAARTCGIKVRISHSHLVVNSKGLKNKICMTASRMLRKWAVTDCMACGQDAGRSLFGDSAEFTVLNNALELEKYSFDEAIRGQVRETLGIAPDDFVVGHVGRFTNQKNHRFIIEIFSALLKKEPNAKLLLVGEGELFEEIQGKIRELGIERSVICTGAVNNVNELLSGMDVFLLPSVSEGLPVVAVEAQAAGLPCVMSKNVTEEVGILSTSTYLDLSDSVDVWSDELLRFREVRRDMDTLTVLREKGYDIETEGKKLDSFYKEAVSGRL